MVEGVDAEAYLEYGDGGLEFGEGSGCFLYCFCDVVDGEGGTGSHLLEVEYLF